MAGKHLTLGTPDERVFGSSAAVQTGSRVFISGLTAEGDGAAAQFQSIHAQAQTLLAGLGTSPADVVRTRVYYVRPEDLATLGAAHGAAFGAARPALTLAQVHFLPGEARVLLEVEAVRGAAAMKRAVAGDLPDTDTWGYSGAVQVGDELWVAGVTALGAGGSVAAPGDVAAQYRSIAARIVGLVEACGGRATDIVATRHYTAVAYAGFGGRDTTTERLALMHPHHPTSAAITVQGVGPRPAAALIEVEAVLGATDSRQNCRTGRPYEEVHHYSRSVRVGDVVYVSGTTSVQLDEEVGSPFDAHGQTVQALEWIRWGIERQGLAFADLVRTRSYVVGEENLPHVARALRETLGGIRPTATVLGVPALGRPSIVVEVEATAVRGSPPA